MKARVKATGEIVEVKWRYLTNLNGFNSIRYVDQKTGISYFEGDLDFDIEGKFAENCLNGIKQGIKYEPDYWEKLLHQYAGMAMQGILSNPKLFKATAKNAEEFGLIVPQAVAIDANCFAHALIQKLKEKEERK